MSLRIVIHPDTFADDMAYIAGCWNHASFITRRELDNPEQVEVIDADHLAHQREWSAATFGPGARTSGVVDHIRKELVEVEAAPEDVTEWADVIILGFDGALRAGHDPQAIIDAIAAKQAKNESRKWPDWRTADPNKAIEHDRSADA